MAMCTESYNTWAYGRWLINKQNLSKLSGAFLQVWLKPQFWWIQISFEAIYQHYKDFSFEITLKSVNFAVVKPSGNGGISIR